jgi:hypothetical protein
MHAPYPDFYWLRCSLINFLLRLALNYDPPDLHFPSWDTSLTQILFFSFFFGETQGFVLTKQALQSRCCTTWVIPPVHFVLLILEIEVSCLGWLWTTILPIADSQAGRITGVYHWCLATDPNSLSSYLSTAVASVVDCRERETEASGTAQSQEAAENPQKG